MIERPVLERGAHRNFEGVDKVAVCVGNCAVPCRLWGSLLNIAQLRRFSADTRSFDTPMMRDDKEAHKSLSYIVFVPIQESDDRISMTMVTLTRTLRARSRDHVSAPSIVSIHILC